MEQQEMTTIETTQVETETELDVLQFITDLDVSEAQDDAIRGGCLTCGGLKLNHNETTASDETVEDAAEFELDDLIVSEEQDDAIRGGCLSCNGLKLNHNETATSDETVEDDAEFELDDLIVSEEQDDAIRGGCVGCGGIKLNHNETTITDDADEAEEDFFQFADLEVTDEQLATITGGPGTGWCTHCTVIYSNHNETVAEDGE